MGNLLWRYFDVNEGGEIFVFVFELLLFFLGCIFFLMEYNVIFRGGFYVGKFIDVGKVDGFYICIELCCKVDNCDVVFFVFYCCFFVNCFDEYFCIFMFLLLLNFNLILV